MPNYLSLVRFCCAHLQGEQHPPSNPEYQEVDHVEQLEGVPYSVQVGDCNTIDHNQHDAPQAQWCDHPVHICGIAHQLLLACNSNTGSKQESAGQMALSASRM